MWVSIGTHTCVVQQKYWRYRKARRYVSRTMRATVSAPFDAANRTRSMGRAYAPFPTLCRGLRTRRRHGRRPPGPRYHARPTLSLASHVCRRRRSAGSFSSAARPADQSPPPPLGSVGALSASTSCIGHGSAKRIYQYMVSRGARLPLSTYLARSCRSSSRARRSRQASGHTPSPCSLSLASSFRGSLSASSPDCDG